MEKKVVIDSLLDTDFYKFTMGQVVFRKFKDVNVTYAFKNRSNGRLYVPEDELRMQLDHAMGLRFNNSELHYLRGTNEYGDRMFTEDYLQFLKELKLPAYRLKYSDSIELEFEGKWSEAIYWETIALSIINEIHNKNVLSACTDFDNDVVMSTGVLNLDAKIKKLKNTGISFTDFGTRRRFSKKWQDYVVGVLAKTSSLNFRGTSNVKLAMEHGLEPMGTSAHEMYMVMAGITDQSDDAIRNSHNKFLELWWDQYGYGLSIALTDTFGSDFFFRDMRSEQAAKWKGLRHDSGDPLVFAQKAIDFYTRLGIDPSTKMIVFSDGLDVDMIIKLHEQFKDKIKVTFGWGTNLTNDLGVKPMSLVVKPIVANGNDLVKLSDNLNKAIGKSVHKYKRIFGHINNDRQECKY